MLWLDSTYPVDSTNPSDQRGTCATDSGDPDVVEKESPDSSVTFSNIKFGAIDSTYDAGSSNICETTSSEVAVLFLFKKGRKSQNNCSNRGKTYSD